MYSEYPNLQLLEEKFKHELIRQGVDVYVSPEFKEYMEKNHYDPPYKFELLGVFKQYWPNTAGLFEDGGFSGQAMSSYYTSVFKELTSNYYAVFQSNRLVYTISEANEKFIEDLNNHTIKCVKEAFKAYTNKEN